MRTFAVSILAALALAVATIHPAASQDTKSRSHIYLGAGVEKEITSKLSAGIDVQGRFCKDDESQKFLVTPQIEYSFIPFASVGAEYRATFNHEEGKDNEWSGRFGTWLKAKWSPSILKLEARIKYCNYTDDVADRDENYANEQYFRTRFLAGVKIKSIKLTPYISYEWFYEFNRNLVDKDRLTIGVKKKLNKNNAIAFEYKFEEKFNRGTSKININNNIFELTYKYTFPYKAPDDLDE
ncbi:MAG: DUF2490 domain-containing protein [Bacteroidales bacterium]|nr:DUF2490 domain-containing protein [Bacteroidales bacterium]